METKGIASEKVQGTSDAVYPHPSPLNLRILTVMQGSIEQNGTTSSIVLSEYGLHRGLKSHHIQLLAISGVIGTGRLISRAQADHPWCSCFESITNKTRSVCWNIQRLEQCRTSRSSHWLLDLVCETEVRPMDMPGVNRNDQVHFSPMCSSCDGGDVCLPPGTWVIRHP